MKKNSLRSFLATLLTLLIFGGVAYYLLYRPYEDLKPEEQISFPTKKTGSGEYPVTVRNVDSLRDRVVIDKIESIEMKDGARLFANVYRPKAPGKYPVVMSFTAYDKDKGPQSYPPVLNASFLDNFNLGSMEVSPWTMWEGPDPAFWVSQGYAVVQVDGRGYFESEGEASLFDEQNISDFHEAITWAGTQEWSNGKVGLNGVSYLAISQWVAASQNPPSYLKAIIPWEGATDSYREVIFHGGIPETQFTRFWLGRVRECANGKKPLPPFPIFKLGQKNPAILQKFQKPPKFDLESIEVPALVCATWSDHGLHSRGSMEGYKRISSPQKWLYTHGRPKWSTYYSSDALYYQKAFFDRFLKGIDNGFDSIPSVRLEVRESLDSFQVRYEKTFPIGRTQYRKYYLNTGNASLQSTSLTEEKDMAYDPMEDKAIFSHRFDTDTELSGHMKLKLWVSTDKGSDMDLFVAVKKLDENGKEVHFYGKTGFTKGPAALGWLRVSERELDEEKSTPWQPVLTHKNPQKISKNQIVPVEIEILPSSTLFRKGESLQVEIQGKDFFSHPSLGHHYSANKGKHSIYTGGKYDSHLLVPFIPALGK